MMRGKVNRKSIKIKKEKIKENKVILVLIYIKISFLMEKPQKGCNSSLERKKSS